SLPPVAHATSPSETATAVASRRPVDVPLIPGKCRGPARTCRRRRGHPQSRTTVVAPPAARRASVAAVRTDTEETIRAAWAEMLGLDGWGGAERILRESDGALSFVRVLGR